MRWRAPPDQSIRSKPMGRHGTDGRPRPGSNGPEGQAPSLCRPGVSVRNASHLLFRLQGAASRAFDNAKDICWGHRGRVGGGHASVPLRHTVRPGSAGQVRRLYRSVKAALCDWRRVALDDAVQFCAERVVWWRVEGRPGVFVDRPPPVLWTDAGCCADCAWQHTCPGRH
jgi:hypothetical protein